MKKIFIIFSLVFISCETKTESQIQAEQIQQQAKEQMNALPVLPAESISKTIDSAEIDWGAPDSTCHN
jgi:hypothetical protein